MELPDIGQNCSLPECSKLDFLPFTCTGCNEIFCLDHRSFVQHNCQSFESNVQQKGGIEKRVIVCCLVEKCQSKEMKTKCDLCGQDCCLRHRHPQDHDCSKLDVKEVPLKETPTEKVERIIGRPLAQTKKGKPTSATATKVMLMKLKMKAIGDKGIPQLERVYFTIVYPSNGPSNEAAVYLSKSWKIGKCIDSVADLLNIKNENQLPGSPKLRLFSTTGLLLPPERSLVSLLDTKDMEISHGCVLEARYV